MSKSRFDVIMSCLRFTRKAPPAFRDKFWQVRDMIAAFNANMAAFFVSGWTICLDEPMSIWHNHWTCPEWIYCPRKPHPYGSEYHTTCCALSGIMFVIKLVEGKDRPREIGLQEFDNLSGKMVGLLLRMLAILQLASMLSCIIVSVCLRD
mmetsp:Transcript_26170/g.44621  ORF Transcript_26170/g.44621 Transcript_26170/m.44621 type:complete len:150 (-) Transcript_26170:1029-1478(-)